MKYVTIKSLSSIWLTQDGKESNITVQQEKQLNDIWEEVRKQNKFIHPFQISKPIDFKQFVFVEFGGNSIFITKGGKGSSVPNKVKYIINKNKIQLIHKSVFEEKNKKEEKLKKFEKEKEKLNKRLEDKAKENKKLIKKEKEGIYKLKRFSSTSPEIMVHDNIYYYWDGQDNWIKYPSNGKKGILEPLFILKDSLERNYKKINNITKEDIKKTKKL